MIELGMRVRDVVTGFEGVAIARVEYITGCDQFGVQPPGMDRDGNLIEARYFDYTRLEIVDAEKVAFPASDVAVSADPGGPERGAPSSPARALPR